MAKKRMDCPKCGGTNPNCGFCDKNGTVSLKVYRHFMAQQEPHGVPADRWPDVYDAYQEAEMMGGREWKR